VIVHGAEVMVPAAVSGLRSVLRRALAGAELLLPVSEYSADRLRMLLRPGSRPAIEVLRAHVDVERYRPGQGAAIKARFGLEGRPLILCFGRLVRRKGVHRLIAALPELRRRVPTAAVLVAGTGPEERRLRRQAAGLGPDGVVFAGRVAEDDALAVYSAADVFALPVADRWLGHEIEGLGVVLVEASAAGVPCVTGRSGGTPEAVIDGRTGYVVDARDRSKLVDRIAGLLEDPEGARRMGAAARAYVAETFSERAATEPLTRWLGHDVR
jgi:phosphatidylinositol alpha-1,6-mannosyltransferase